MNMIDTKHLSKALTERFGLEVDAYSSLENNGQKVIIRPSGIEHTISFQVEFHLGWRTINALFIPGNYASELVKGTRSASESQKAAFAVFSDSLKFKGASVLLNFDHQQVNASEPSSWPRTWENISIAMKKIGVIVENETGYDFDAVFPWATGFFGLAIALLPLEEVKEPLSEGEVEGTALLKVVKHFERSRINRAACIEVHGTDCKICGFSFGDVFGELGDGFIHVHHVIPLSEMGAAYVLNPAKDLIPICPNCHSMLHRRKPAFLPKELIHILSKRK
ncbi:MULTISPECIES: HNH endonuclease [Legionella]|uniref:HNH endonuclease n=1 Tax=Legionella shakespearei DSM 23087 TaxID=1122169 RepID=A0A0W0YKB0_9GAMM|nr:MULTISPECIES: HNH endonuclease [Legionella]KTD57325.1 HNH endonuclease [Legionella shakespearei DSM 23087]MCW8451739.1 HNH endonuclease [Legionella quinlivanii]